jgi:hypothetical protein
VIAKLFSADDITDVFQIVSYHDEGTGYLELVCPDGSTILNDYKVKTNFVKQDDEFRGVDGTTQCDILTEGGILLVSYKYPSSDDPHPDLAQRLFPPLPEIHG